MNVSAVILAGGRATRMNGVDKGLVLFNHKPLIEHVIQSIQDDVEEIQISANRNISTYQQYGYPVIPDHFGDFAGPLAGLLSAMHHASHQWILCLPCDAPFIQSNLIKNLKKPLINSDFSISVAFDGIRLQPTFSIHAKKLYPDLGAFLERGNRAIKGWIAENNAVSVDLSAESRNFININSLNDIEAHENNK